MTSYWRHTFGQESLDAMENSVVPRPCGSTIAVAFLVERGELDFYINGSLQWCLELLRNGDKIGERLARFKPRTGKYRNVEAKDYLVVDCRPPKRGNGAQIAVDRCNLYFEENFTKCRVQMRTKPEQLVSLQP